MAIENAKARHDEFGSSSPRQSLSRSVFFSTSLVIHFLWRRLKFRNKIRLPCFLNMFEGNRSSLSLRRLSTPEWADGGGRADGFRVLRARRSAGTTGRCGDRFQSIFD